MFFSCHLFDLLNLNSSCYDRWEVAMDSKASKPNCVHCTPLRPSIVSVETNIRVCNTGSHHQVSVSADWQPYWQPISARPLCSCWYADHRNGSL